MKRRRRNERTCFDSSATSLILRPMKRFTEAKVFSGLTTAWRLAICCQGGLFGGGRRRRKVRPFFRFPPFFSRPLLRSWGCCLALLEEETRFAPASTSDGFDMACEALRSSSLARGTRKRGVRRGARWRGVGGWVGGGGSKREERRQLHSEEERRRVASDG